MNKERIVFMADRIRGMQMPIKGTWKDGYYVPEPSVQAFEKFLADRIAEIPCAECGKSIGEGNIRISAYKLYHPQCKKET